MKFKVWDKKYERMLTESECEGLAIEVNTGELCCSWVDSLYVDNPDGAYESRDSGEFIVLQYTGLKDKNGQEIYEGDIVTLSGSEPHVIKFQDGGFGWDGMCDDFIGFAGHTYFDKIMKRCNIIGNIHENPELLEKT